MTRWQGNKASENDHLVTLSPDHHVIFPHRHPITHHPVIFPHPDAALAPPCFRRHAVGMIVTASLTYRTIDPVADATLVVANHHDACVASFGSDCSYEGAGRYLTWLRGKVEEFPEGCV